MQCVAQISGICFVTPTNAGDASVFRFTDFITALALLVIVYTVSDVRYRFRVAIAPTMFHLYVETFVLIGVIGLGTILTDIWLVEHWPVPESLITQSIWRGVRARRHRRGRPVQLGFLQHGAGDRLVSPWT